MVEIQKTLLVEESFWTKYNKSQTREKILFIRLLHELCDIIPDKFWTKGTKPIRLSQIIFCLTMKSYCLKSSRRIIGELEMCRRMGLIKKVPHFNTLLNYLKNPSLTPILQNLIKFTSLPLMSVEKKFCCDSSGFGNSVLDDRWSQIRQQYSKHHKYYKAHITFGVLTGIITSCRVTKGNVADSPLLLDMVDETAENFNMEEFSADKAYSSRINLEAIWKYNCLPLIPFKENSRPQRGGLIWTEMYNFFKQNNELFMKKYHLRSNAESGMHSIKSKYGDLTNMRNEIGAINDVLSKLLCQNLSTLCKEIFLLGIKFNFAQFKDKIAQD